MCSNVPILEQRGHAGVSILPHVHSLDGHGRFYISLLIIPCIIYYVTNKETLNLEDVIDSLNQKLDPLRVPLPDVLPSDNRLLPLHPGALLPHGHCSAGSLFLD